MSTFKTGSDPLQTMLSEIGKGRIQLPVFQRPWVWDDYHIRSLIASISQALPIGSVLTLQAGGTEIRFKTRLLKGVGLINNENGPDTLILDGQQRLTALYQCLMSENAVYTQDSKNNKIRQYYYFDMRACLEDIVEREEAVLSCGKDYVLRRASGETVELTAAPQSSVAENEYKNDMFPVNKTFNLDDWQIEYQAYWNFDKEKVKFFSKFLNTVLRPIREYHVPVIELPRETPKEAICLAFEKVNSTGVKLTNFELLTATFAADDFDLRKDWNERYKEMKEKHPVLAGLESTNFMRGITLLATNAKADATISCTRREVLQLTLEEYNTWADKLQNGFIEAANFLRQQKVFKANDLPYQTQIVPLAVILTSLGELSETAQAREKISRWYWCGVLGEMYSHATDTQFANDFSKVPAWVTEDAEEPRVISEANFHENRLSELRRRNSAAYKGIHALVMQDRDPMSCSDFRTGNSISQEIYFDESIDIHHIFPKAWCDKQKTYIKPDDYNSIINKTALSQRTNRKIGGRAPSEYLTMIEKEWGTDPAKMNRILESHFIDPHTLRDDNFEEFFEARKEALLNAIEKAMGKKVTREGDDPEDPAPQ